MNHVVDESTKIVAEKKKLKILPNELHPTRCALVNELNAYFGEPAVPELSEVNDDEDVELSR